jgi:glycosyltransferase involved in cell wall biosynthesis
MRVLVLGPAGRWPEQITAFSFLDEEIHGLARAGVQPWVLSPSVGTPQNCGDIRIVPLAPGSWRDRARTLRLLATHRARLPSGWRPGLRGWFHAIRVEQVVSDMVREHEIDLIHSHFGPLLGLGGLLASRETGRPLVASLRGMDVLVDPLIDYGLRLNPVYERALFVFLRTADRTTYPSDFLREHAVRLGADPANAITIRKGVDLEHFHVSADRGALRAELGITSPMILTVAGLIRRKGVDTLIRALALLPEGCAFTLVVCGDGPEQPALQELSAELGIADRVVFKGRVARDQIPRYFSACDLFVLASRTEAAGNVVLEAMASGRPVVCTDSGGPPEYVRDGQTGFVVPVDAPVALGDRIRLLLEDEEAREVLGRQGRIVAERDHPYSALVEGYLSVYRSVLSTGPAAAG